MSIADHFRL